MARRASTPPRAASSLPEADALAADSGQFTPPAAKRQRRSNMTVEQKRRLCEKHRAEPKLTQTELCAWAKLEFNLVKAPSQGGVSLALRKEHLYKDSVGDQLGGGRKKIRTARHSHFDRVLANWALERLSQGVVTSSLIREGGRALALKMGIEDTLRFSNGWIHSFRARHGFIKREVSTQSALVTSEASNGLSEDPNQLLPPVSTNLTLEQIRDLLVEYETSDVYTVGEAGLFFRASPATLAKGEPDEEEARLTVLLATNADASDLVEPYLIGDVASPPGLEQRGFHYVGSSKARLTVFVFHQWLRNFNARMASSHRHVLVLLDTAPSHVVGFLDLSHVRLVVLNPLLGARVQPMYCGILMAFKSKYRVKHLSRAANQLEAGFAEIYHVTQLQAMQWVAEAWQQIPSDVIKAAWKPLGISSTVGALDANHLKGALDKLLYRLHFNGLVAPAVLVDSLWENDVHKRFDEDLFESPPENDQEFTLPRQEVAVPPLTPEEKRKAYSTVIHDLERSTSTHEPNLLAVVLTFLREQQLG
ncbi:hypothetical protein BBJ28_00018212 [Nothophytophthora sp. Chile5]|nr:hypothetical protein BBJ28_00018212 [Nothophytophthora sp. Chile5]